MIKALTAASMLICLATLGTYPWTVGKPPLASEKRAVKQAYAVRSATFFGVICFSLVGAAVGSALILRQARAEYREHSMQNLKKLITPEASDDPKNDAN